MFRRPNRMNRPPMVSSKPSTSSSPITDMFAEASDSVRSMHEIGSILRNDDIPIDSREYFLRFVNTSLQQDLTKQQRRNVKIFTELFVRIDKDMRMFREFLNLAVHMAEHFNFENHSLVYAFRNISLSEHFTSFVDFARRRNPIIEKNSPLQLFLTLGMSIIRLAFKKQGEMMHQVNAAKEKESLMKEYKLLSENMSKRLIVMDFGEMLNSQKSQSYEKDLDTFDKDDDDYDEEEDGEDIKPTVFETRATIETIVEESEEAKELEEEDTKVEAKDEVEDDDDDDDDVEDVIENLLYSEDHDSGILGCDNESDDENNNRILKLSSSLDPSDGILKTLNNGNTEVNLEELNSFVVNKIGPVVYDTLTSHKDEPIIRFKNHNVQNIVDFISSETVGGNADVDTKN